MIFICIYSDSSPADSAYNSCSVSTTTVNEWDLFQLENDDDCEQENVKFWDYATKGLKVVVYIGSFIFVLTFAVIAKATLFLMTSQLHNAVSSENVNDSYPLTICFGATDKFAYGRYNDHKSATARWYWSLWFAMSLPHVLSLYPCLKALCFKRTPRMPLVLIILVST